MGDRKNETDVIREQHKSLEQLDREHRNDAPVGSIPVTWSNPLSGEKLRGRPLTVVPTDEEIARLGAPRAACCGTCKNYDLEGGRKEIIKQRFAERVVRDEGWKLSRLGSPDELAICRANPSLAVSYVSDARTCPSYRPREVKR